MAKFPVDAPKPRVVRTFEKLGFQLVREREHISMVRQNPDGSRTPLTIRTICRHAAISREDFLAVYDQP